MKTEIKILLAMYFVLGMAAYEILATKYFGWPLYLAENWYGIIHIIMFGGSMLSALFGIIFLVFGNEHVDEDMQKNQRDAGRQFKYFPTFVLWPMLWMGILCLQYESWELSLAPFSMWFFMRMVIRCIRRGWKLLEEDARIEAAKTSVLQDVKEIREEEVHLK